MSNRTDLVIPAQAGIHGLTERFEQRVLGIRIVPTMDSRLRGNDKVCGCEVG